MTHPQVDRQLRLWAASHHSIIGRNEAFSLGASPADVRTRLRRGEWFRRYEGVYQDAAAPPTPYQPLRAAFIALRGRAVASHASAAWIWGLIPTPPDRPDFTVDFSTGGRPAREWTLHRSRDLDLSRNSVHQTIPVTNPLRTLVDLAAFVLPAQLTSAVDIAIATRLVTDVGLTAEIGRLARHGRPGVAALRRHLLERGYIGAPAPSVLEAKFHRLIVKTGLPFPVVELRVEGGRYRLDIAWAEIRFAVEADGYAWHFSPEHARHDEARRQGVRDKGWYLKVYTWLEIVREPDRVIREITEKYLQLSRPGGRAGAG